MSTHPESPRGNNGEYSALAPSPLAYVHPEGTPKQGDAVTVTGNSASGQGPSPHRPRDLDAWLLDCAPVPECDVCAANWRQLVRRKRSGDVRQAARHATEIRDHASGVHTVTTYRTGRGGHAEPE